jgi:RNA 2',3'-cyclic 3'-phosphodiesterase
MRLFIALDLDDAVRNRAARFIEEMQAFAPNAHWIKLESLHITLKFIGEQPEASVTKIDTILRTIKSVPVTIDFRGAGFFPSAHAPRIFWIGLQAGPELGSFAATVDDKMAALGIPKEERPYSPHLTIARGGSRKSGAPKTLKGDRSNHIFHRLQERLSALPQPEFGTMTAREFFLYRSELSAKGSKYTKLTGFKLNPH